MGLTPEDVDEILRYLEHSAFDELELETPQFKLVVRRGQRAGGSNNVPAEPLPAGETAEKTASPPPSVEAAAATSQEAHAVQGEQRQADVASDGQIAIPARCAGSSIEHPGRVPSRSSMSASRSRRTPSSASSKS